MIKNYTNFLQFVLFFIFLSVLPSQVQAQCGGIDGQKVICNVENPVNKSISLFSLLGGFPTPGGTWTDDNNSRGLDPRTGFLNAQIISKGGVYRYTYTAPNVAGCTNRRARVTIIIGAYAGLGTHATVCSDELTFNLFTAFNSTVMGPHSNGTWTDIDGKIVRSTIPIDTIHGTFEFKYTVPPVLQCSPVAPTATVFVTIVRAPRSGKGSEPLLCNTNLGSYTDIDLHDYITDEDSIGEWTGPGITSVTDSKVDLKSVYDSRGPGEFTYTYKVYAVPNNRVCPDKSTEVIFTIEKQLDFTGAQIVVSSDICEDRITTATYSAKITQGAMAIPNGEYSVTFAVSGSGEPPKTITADFVDGILNFPVEASYFNRVGKFTLTIINIEATSSKKACTNIINNLFDDLNIYPLPHLDNAIITVNPVCQNDVATVQISNATQLLNGNYRISYNINGDNLATGQTANITALDGNATFQIRGSLNTRSGLSVITITNIINITNPTPQCSNTANVIGNLTVNPLPAVADVKVLVNDNCFNGVFTTTVSGLGNLTEAKLSYVLLDSNIATEQTVDLTVSNGNASFVIPSNLLVNTGSTVISATYLTNDVTGCGNALVNVLDSFLVNPIPLAPTVVNPPDFCKVDRATIANLTPHGSQYKWYNSATLTTPLADNYVLKSENLYATETSVAGCTSPASMITVVVKDTPAPTLNPDGQNFCGLKNPTISDLSKATNVASTVSWYDAPDNGNLLTSATLLRDKATYYGFDLSNVTNCISNDYLEVSVSLSDCDPTEYYSFFIPDGFSPNGDNVNDTFRIPDIEFLYPDYTIEIFNRYGNVMFKGNANKPNWDGRNSESAGFGDGIAPNGVYFYVINFNKDNKKAQQGRLYLNR